MNPASSLACVGLVILSSSCLASRSLEMPSLANAHVSEDFDTYALERVGLMPFAGSGVTKEQSRELQMAFFSEISRSTPFELVLLDGLDLEAVDASDPYRKGWYKPKTIIGLSRRSSLDAVLFGTVTQQRFFAPQILSLQMDLVAAETGLVIWSSTIHLDATDQRVRDGLQLFYSTDSDEDGSVPPWQVSLLSPERFARFAAFQVACVL